ncbi:Clavaminate synthase-like protein [Armillaria gallica]|uniref:Clavaminate synthase-like protein n=1 Tax=Armillaria gallica TaxID=47427 RepID=A0A2H3CAD4_ARMGA|nr:Clavaminate synthase-like protein [Armillaria gallica]
MLSPPFPDEVPTHPLLIIDYQLLQEGDAGETERLWEAARKLGFWYLKNHGIEEEASRMFNMGQEMMRLPLEEKMKYGSGNDGRSFGYKAAGSTAIDVSGQQDTIEYVNVSKDDALAYPNIVHCTYPSTVNKGMESTITPFVTKSPHVNDMILEILNDKLGLPKGMLTNLHPKDEYGGSEARTTKNPPGYAPDRMAIGAHMDFGSLSFLHNRLGGLQVLPPGYKECQYVKPIPGHTICNVGDALSLFSGGILRLNLHRVLPPPGLQSHLDRYSLVFFTRPGNSVILRALVEDSPLITEAVRSTLGKNFESGKTAKEWFTRWVKY